MIKHLKGLLIYDDALTVNLKDVKPTPKIFRIYQLYRDHLIELDPASLGYRTDNVPHLNFISEEVAAKFLQAKIQAGHEYIILPIFITQEEE